MLNSLFRDRFKGRKRTKTKGGKRMKAKVQTTLMLALLLALTVFPIVFAQDTVGVKAGDWVKYKITRLGSSSAWVENAVWIEVEVLNVSDTTVTIRETIHYDDGSELVRNFSSNLPTHHYYIIAANLGPGDKVDTIPVWNDTNELVYIDLTLSDTDHRNYGGVTREVNQLKYSKLWEDAFLPGQFINGTLEQRWDKCTGFLLEWNVQKYYLGYEDYPSTFKLEIEDTNLWEMEKPKQTPWWLAAIPIGAVIVTAVVVKLRNDKKKNEDNKQ
jgi:hypothetical protein